MKNIKIILPAFLLFIFISSCKKEELNDYVIKDITYEFTDLNDCQPDDGGANGSSLTLSLMVDNPNYEDIYGLKVIFKQKKKKDDVQIISRELDLSIEIDKINTFRCLRFGSLSEGIYEVSILTMDGLESEPYTLKVDRPAGAN